MSSLTGSLRSCCFSLSLSRRKRSHQLSTMAPAMEGASSMTTMVTGWTRTTTALSGSAPVALSSATGATAQCCFHLNGPSS